MIYKDQRNHQPKILKTNIITYDTQEIKTSGKIHLQKKYYFLSSFLFEEIYNDFSRKHLG